METGKATARRYEEGGFESSEETLTEEGPLQIKVNGAPFTVTMRTPGHDRELVRGLLFTEGVLPSGVADLDLVEQKAPESGLTVCMNVRVAKKDIIGDFENRRSLLATSSCGLCGRKDLADLENMPPRLREAGLQLSATLVEPIMSAMRDHQNAFNRSGGSHAAGLFTMEGDLIVVYEDIGRHNAVDKVIGWMLENSAENQAKIMSVSGRISFEIILKAWRARVPFLMAVSAPSTLAVKMAEEAGMTILGFCRGGRATVYSRPERVVVFPSSNQTPGSRT